MDCGSTVGPRRSSHSDLRLRLAVLYGGGVARSTIMPERPAVRRNDAVWTVAERVFPVVVVPASLVALVVALGFYVQVPWATRLWPWPATPLSYIFIGSILTAIAIPLLWIGVTGETAAIQAGALDLAVMFGGMFIYL